MDRQTEIKSETDRTWMRPTAWTGRGMGASLPSDGCVRACSCAPKVG